MKGIVFTEFLELVENHYGLEVVDQLIRLADLPSGGAYTAVGTYDFAEMLSLLRHLSEHSGLSIDDLLLLFAQHFFGVLAQNYPELIAKYKDPIDLLASIENHIHVEVRKIYPEAELPTFKVLQQSPTTLLLHYSSSRAMHSFGLGLMQETFAHFDARAKITVEKLNEKGTEVHFNITKIIPNNTTITHG